MARLPVDAGVVASQPGEAQDELEVAEAHDVAGKVFGMGTMNTEMRGVKVGNRASCRDAAVDELEGNRKGMGVGV